MSRIPPLPDYAIMCDCGANCYTADQLRARDRQIVEACIAEAERQRGALTAGGAFANGMRSAYEHMAHRLRSLLGEGEGNTNGG